MKTENRLTPIRKVPRPDPHTYWLCQCACGNTIVVRGNSTGPYPSAKSCGCWRREFMRDRHTTHGLSYSRTMRIWNGVIQRCQNKKNKRYADYGGRGITVCARWQTFQNFLADMGECPSNKHSINRVDNDGPYSPENCEWATDIKQRRNKRSTILVCTANGVRNLKERCAELGISYSTVRGRLANGMPFEEALSRPVQQHRMWRRRVK